MAIYDWETKLKDVQRLNAKMPLRDACKKVGISYSAYHKWRLRKKAITDSFWPRVK